MRRSLLSLHLAILLAGSSVLAAEYEIDPDHSSVGFRVRHLGISSVSGNFLKFSGSLSFDPAKIGESTTQAKIESTSIDTQQTKRDNHLRSGDFLLAEKHPLIEFKSKGVEPVDDKNFKVKGDLTIRGVTKPVVLDVEYGGSAIDPWGNERVAFTASTAIDRQEFGVSYNKTLDAGGLVVGDEVKVILEIEGIKKKAA